MDRATTESIRSRPDNRNCAQTLVDATPRIGIRLAIAGLLLFGGATPDAGGGSPAAAAPRASRRGDQPPSTWSPPPSTRSLARQAARLTLLPPVDSSAAIVTPRAKQHIAYALDLAERGAIYSAREEFVMALELVAEALDADTATKAHTIAVEAGLQAMKDADDFAPRPLRSETDLDLAQLAAVHRTAILKRADTSKLTPTEAIQRYYAYATEQLARAGGTDPTASTALYGLGRVASVTTDAGDIRSPMSGPKAIAFYQAALLVNRRNHMAANELGVMLARYGQMQQARAQLRHSLTIAPQPETWHNLSAVCQSLGRYEEAQRARTECETLTAAHRARGGSSTSSALDRGRPLIRTVAPETFARTGAPYGLDGPAMETAGPIAPQRTVEPTSRRATSANRGWFARWIPWRRQETSRRSDAVLQMARRPSASRGS